MTDAEKQQASAVFKGIFERSAAAALSERYDMIVLDEVFDVINEGMLGEAQVLEFITNAPNSIEIVMTGHNPPGAFHRRGGLCDRDEKDKAPL